MNVQPHKGRCLIRWEGRLSWEEDTDRIIIPAKPKPGVEGDFYGTVLAVGPDGDFDCPTDKERVFVAADFEPGDRVLFEWVDSDWKDAGSPMGERECFVQIRDVLAVIDE